MKIRSSFVSNSSTASFVAIGYKIEVPKGQESTAVWLFENLFTESQLDGMMGQYTGGKSWKECNIEEQEEAVYEWKWGRDNDLHFMLNCDDGLEDDDHPVVGYRLLDVDGYDGLPYMEVMIGKLLSDLWKLKEKLNIDENNQPFLFVGTRAN